jgi:signal transduction histidine kinase
MISATPMDAEELKTNRSISVHIYDVANDTLIGSQIQSSGRQNIMDIINENQTDEIFISSTGGQNSRINWLTYIGKTNDGNLVLTRISYANMDSVVVLVQQFFLIFGFFLAAVFVIFAFVFSRSMSKPLKELNTIAEKMGKLDFSLRYSGNRKDEIGQLGQALNSLTANLENTITQLKSELKKEKTLEKMRTGFTAQVSHELQTPLSVIRGYAEALSDKVYAAEEIDDVYGIILTETNRISMMVDDLLDLSQMEAGAYVVRKKEFSLSGLLEKIYLMHRKLPNEKNISFSFSDNSSGNASMFGDPLRLEQAFRNIAGNAMKHVSSDGEITFTLSGDTDTYQINIFNTGEPIPDDDIDEIFEAYYQGSNKKSGTGLGLAISRHIISLHGGSISAGNENGGVNITVILRK